MEIVFSNISKKYPKGVVALNDIDATIPSRKLVAFIGSNGSGKSTALKLLAGVIPPSSGTVDFLGLNPQKDTHQIRKNIGYISQDSSLDPHITGREAFHLFCALHGINGAKKEEITQKLYTTYGLQNHIDKKIRTYSGGLKQRLHIALSLVHQPKQILLDEPTNSLDPKGKNYVWETLAGYSDKSIFIVTHDLHEVARYCDWVILFHKGKVLAQGEPESIIQENRSTQIQIIYKGQSKQPIPRLLESLEGLTRVSANTEQITLNFEENLYNEATLLALLEREGIRIVEIRKHNSDLSSAYFNLTGSTVSNELNKGKRKR